MTQTFSNPADHSRYRRAVGMLQWIVCDRTSTNHLHLRLDVDLTALRHLVGCNRTTSDLELRIQPKTRTRVPEGEPELLSVDQADLVANGSTARDKGGIVVSPN